MGNLKNDKSLRKRAPRGKGDETTRLEIINAARQAFSNKGYSAANMGEISELAGVNRALPYYYFKEKRQLFEEVIRSDINDLLLKRSEYAGSLGNKVWDRESVKEFYRMMFNFLKEKRQMLTLSISEGIKENAEQISLVKLLDPIFSGFLKYLESSGFPVNDKMDFLITSFFFSTVPMVMYIVLEDKFAGFYGFDEQKQEEKFIEVFSRIYIENGYEAAVWNRNT